MEYLIVMKPPACTQCRWGTGTTKEKVSTNHSSKELDTKLAQLIAARDLMDASINTSAGTTHLHQASSSGTNQYAPSLQRKVTGNP